MPRVKNGGAHGPKNVDQSFRPATLKLAASAMLPRANPRNADGGRHAVCASTALVERLKAAGKLPTLNPVRDGIADTRKK